MHRHLLGHLLRGWLLTKPRQNLDAALDRLEIPLAALGHPVLKCLLSLCRFTHQGLDGIRQPRGPVRPNTQVVAGAVEGLLVRYGICVQFRRHGEWFLF
jgi:hypothetical protein